MPLKVVDVFYIKIYDLVKVKLERNQGKGGEHDELKERGECNNGNGKRE